MEQERGWAGWLGAPRALREQALKVVRVGFGWAVGAL